MSALVRLSLRFRTVTLLVVVVLLVAGGLAVTQLNRELFPEVEPPFLVVTTAQPGAGPEQVAEGVATPIEEALQRTEGLEHVQSTSLEGFALVFAQYRYGTDMEERATEARESFADLGLPEGVEQPEVQTISPDSLPIFSVAVTGGEAQAFARDTLVPAVSAAEGVASVQTAGADEQVVRVQLDPAELEANGLSVPDVITALQSAGVTAPVGIVEADDLQLPVRLTEDLDPDAIADITIPPSAAARAAAAAAAGQGQAPGAAAGQAPGAAAGQTPAAGAGQTPAAGAGQAAGAAQDPAAGAGQAAGAAQDPAAGAGQAAGAAQGPVGVRLGDLGDVEVEAGEQADVLARFDGEAAVLLEVVKDQAANTVATVEAVQEAIDGVSVPDGIALDVVLNQAPEIEAGVADVAREAVIGAVLAIIMIVLFLRSLRGTFVAGISIPLSLLTALLVMNGSDISLNILTLGALSVAAGRVIDDAIVVLENVYRLMEGGADRREAALTGTVQVIPAITSSTLTTVAVFLPLGFIGGLVGEVFVGFALTVTFALLASLLVAATVVPVLASLFLRTSDARKADPEHSPLRRVVRPPLRWALRHRAVTLTLALLALAGSAWTATQVPVSLFPSTEAEAVDVSVSTDPGTTTAATAAAVLPLERAIADIDGVERYTTTVGSSQEGGIGALAGGGGGPNSARLTVALADGADTEQVVADIQDALDDTGLDGSIAEEQLVPGGSEFQVQITGADFEAVTEATGQVEEAFAEFDGLEDLSSNLSEARPELTVDVDEEAIAAFGLDANTIAQLLRATLNPVPATTVEVDGEDRQVVVALDPASLAGEEELRALPLAPGLRLGDIGTVNRTPSPTTVTSYDGDRSAQVTGTITSDNIGDLTTRAQAELDGLDLPEGTDAVLVGVNEQLSDSFSGMLVAMGVAVGLVYLVMVATFGSLLTPFVILLTLPLAAIGAFPALWLTGRELGLPTLIGLLMLIGIVVTNAIVLLDFTERLKREGRPTNEALVLGAEIRVRPILMTALATIFGLIPLALGLSEGALLSAALATVVIGGLLTSTLLTLVVIPVVYSLFDGLRTRVTASGHQEEETPAEQEEPEPAGHR